MSSRSLPAGSSPGHWSGDWRARGSSRSLVDPYEQHIEGGRNLQCQLPPYAAWRVNREIRRSTELEAASVRARASSNFGTPKAADRSSWEQNLMGMRSILRHPFSVFLVALPLGITASLAGWGPKVTFWLNFLALVPLAKILGDATEELDAALRNETVSGLLTATFGNAVELIMTMQSLKAGLISVVKATLLGSVLSNLLLVLGLSFFFGGILDISVMPAPLVASFREGLQPLLHSAQDWRMHLVAEKEQAFFVNSALLSVSMLLVSCMALALPTIFAQGVHAEQAVLDFSRTAAVIVILNYFACLVFQLGTHRKLLAREQDSDVSDDTKVGLTLGCCIGLLFITTVLVSISSQLLVSVLEDVVYDSGLSEAFIGVVLLPIVGNACEHAAAIRFAVQNKPGLSISIAVGSSTQIALFVVPLAVLMGWTLGEPMDLNFGVLNVTVLVISVLVVLTIIVDGHSNWLEGYTLCSSYALIAVMYFHVL